MRTLRERLNLRRALLQIAFGLRNKKTLTVIRTAKDIACNTAPPFGTMRTLKDNTMGPRRRQGSNNASVEMFAPVRAPLFY
jgi:hypothetical protein